MLIETIRRKLEEKRIDRKRQRLEVIMKVLDDIVELIKERCGVDRSAGESSHNSDCHQL